MSEGISVGAVIFIAAKPIVKIYLIMFMGWLLVKHNILTVETTRGISNMVVNALLPCLSFNKIVTNLSGSQIKEIGVTILTALVIFSTGGALATLGRFITPTPKKWVWGLIFGGIFANISDLPIAYTQSMGTGIVFNEEEANKGVALSCIFLACQQFLLMNMGMFQLVGLDFKENNGHENENVKDVEIGNNAIDEDKNQEFNVVPLVRDEDEDGSSDSASQNGYRKMRRRRSSANSGVSFSRIRSLESSYSTRSKKSRYNQNVESLIEEYSEAYRLRSKTIDLARIVSKTQEIGLNVDEEEAEELKNKSKKSKYSKFIKTYKLSWLDFLLVNSIRVPSVVLLISILVSMVPWLRALFVKNSIKIHSAPDELPPLSFVMDFTLYVGNAAVPMGLLLLGGTIARLKINEIPKGFWKTSLFLTLCRLVIMPILGVLWTNRLYSSGWITDDISRFVLIISWAVPSATAQVYFTAFYTPLDGDHIQMDCLAIFLLMQYPILVVTLAITVSYVLKVTLGF